MVARIDHERAEREALEQQRQELLKRKAKLIAENKKRKDDLANLDKDLERFIDVCMPNHLRVTDSCRDTLGKILTSSDIGRQANPEALRKGRLRCPSNIIYYWSTWEDPSSEAYANNARKPLSGSARTSLTIRISNYLFGKMQRIALQDRWVRFPDRCLALHSALRHSAS
jgi:hypothetical protein